MILVDFKILTFANCHCRWGDANVKSNPLADIGVVHSEPNIRNKLGRGSFTAASLIERLELIGVSSLRFSD